MRTLIVVLLVVLTLVGTASQHSVAQEATNPTLVTIQSAQSSDLRQLLPKEYPPVPDWVKARFEADPSLSSAVALPDGKWVFEVRTFNDAWDALNVLWVSGFDDTTTAKELYNLFATIGGVKDVELRASYGVSYYNYAAVVTMASADLAKAAASRLNKQEFHGELYVVAKPDDWVRDGELGWELYDQNGVKVPSYNTAHGTGWEDRVWPNGFYDTVWESPYYTANPVDYSSNVVGAGGYVFLFDRNDPAKPILAAYDDSNGQLLFDRSRDKECVLPVRQFHYCQQINRQKLLNLAEYK